MTEVPQRSSLVSQVVEILRADLQRGEWTSYLPGERALCDRLQVSRITLRAALEVLRREGLVQVAQGRRRSIVHGRALAHARKGSNVIGLISPLPLHAMSSLSLFLIGELQGHLHDAGYRLDVHAHPRFGMRDPSHTLAELMKQAHADCWIIHGGTRAIERWFVEHRVRGITVGWSNEEVHLPCLGVDYRAICRHAVGVFLARGHRRLTMLLPGEATDDQDHEQGFLEGLRAAGGHPEVQGRVVRHDGTVKSIQRALRDIRRSDPPSGLLVVRPKFALTALTCLLNSGLKMPRDVSLISTGYEPYLENLSPSVAHYAINWSSFARRLFRMVLRQATVGTVSLSPVLVTAEFRPGETLAAKK